MNALIIFLFLIVLIAFPGCATRARVELSQAVGPARPHITRRTGAGVLVVFSALDLANTADSDHPTHTGYSIYTQDGNILRRVDNRAGSFYQDPVLVALPTGTYKVEAEATNNGLVIVPVVIEDGQTTILDLDGSTLPQSKPQSGDEWVRLPDGQVIGSRAN